MLKRAFIPSLFQLFKHRPTFKRSTLIVMNGNVFIGRLKECKFLSDDLNRSDDTEDSVKIYYFKGEEGIGKTAFLRHFPSKIGLSLETSLWFRAGAEFHNTPSTENLPDLLIRSLNSRNAGDPLRSALAKKKHQQHVNSAYLVDNKESTPLQDWENIFREYIAHEGNSSKTRLKTRRVFFEFDDYDRLSQKKKEWLARYIVLPLATHSTNIECRFLLTGRKSFRAEEDIDKYWAPFRNKILEIDIPPLSKDELDELLDHHEIKGEQAKEIEKSANGNPGKILKKIGILAESEAEITWGAKAKKLLDSLDEKETRWVMWASFLENVSMDNLRIFCEGKEAADVFLWLGKNRELDFEKTNDSLILDKNYAHILLKYLRIQNEKAFNEYMIPANLYKEIVQSIPRSEHREMLVLLSAFDYFNAEAVKKLFHNQSDKILFFVQNNSGYFDKTTSNYRLKPEFRKMINAYRNLTKALWEDNLVNRIEGFWRKKQKLILRDIQRCKQRRHLYNQMVGDLSERLRSASKKIKFVETSLQTKKNQVPNVGSNSRQSRFFVSLLFEALGTAMLYLGILYFNKFAAEYVTVGIALIVLGIYWPHKETEPETSPQYVPNNDNFGWDDFARVREKKRQLHIHMDELKLNRSNIQEDISAATRELDKLGAELGEPYCETP